VSAIVHEVVELGGHTAVTPARAAEHIQLVNAEDHGAEGAHDGADGLKVALKAPGARLVENAEAPRAIEPEIFSEWAGLREHLVTGQDGLMAGEGIEKEHAAAAS